MSLHVEPQTTEHTQIEEKEQKEEEKFIKLISIGSKYLSLLGDGPSNAFQFVCFHLSNAFRHVSLVIK